MLMARDQPSDTNILSGMRTGIIFMLLIAAACAPHSQAAESEPSPKGTSTEWRDDEKNLIVVRDLNRAYARLPFSREYDGVLDHCPFALTCFWVSDGNQVFGFGGEPGHGYSDNTETVLQIGTIQLNSSAVFLK
jgi:hypothetical protein